MNLPCKTAVKPALEVHIGPAFELEVKDRPYPHASRPLAPTFTPSGNPAHPAVTGTTQRDPMP